MTVSHGGYGFCDQQYALLLSQEGVKKPQVRKQSRTPVPRTANPNPDAEFSNIVVRPGGMRPILREHRPPHNDT